jgi:RNA polymerase-binding transcription factor DksA
MSETVDSTLRATLADERDALRRRLAELGEGDERDSGPSFDDGFADSSQVAAEQGEVRALAADLRSLLDDVERALGKLDDGTYGRCETCDEPIAPARLEAMPASRYCVDHA